MACRSRDTRRRSCASVRFVRVLPPTVGECVQSAAVTPAASGRICHSVAVTAVGVGHTPLRQSVGRRAGHPSNRRLLVAAGHMVKSVRADRIPDSFIAEPPSAVAPRVPIDDRGTRMASVREVDLRAAAGPRPDHDLRQSGLERAAVPQGHAGRLHLRARPPRGRGAVDGRRIRPGRRASRRSSTCTPRPGRAMRWAR